MPTFNVLESFIPTLTTSKRYIDLLGGRGRGGSHFVTQYALMRIMHPSYFRGYFMRRVFNDIRDSLWTDFKDRVEEMAEAGELNPSDFHFNENQMRAVYLPTGNKIISKGLSGDANRKAKLKSLAGATHVFMEEANESRESEFNQLDDSLRTAKGTIQIFRVFNPPARQHWMWRDYILHPTEYDGYLFPECTNPDILSIFSTYKNNRVNINQSSADKWEGYKTTGRAEDFDHYLRDICGLVGDGVKGRIYSGWKPCSIDQYNNIDFKEVYGLDFGFSPDPTAFVGIKFDGRDVYVRQLIYETALTDADLCRRLLALGIGQSDFIISDPGGGGSQRIYGFHAGIEVDGSKVRFKRMIPAKKGSGSIKDGIGQVKDYNVYVVDGSPAVWDEYNSYHLRADAEGLVTPEPVDTDNHTMDAIRYVVMSKRLKLF